MVFSLTVYYFVYVNDQCLNVHPNDNCINEQYFLVTVVK